MRTNPITAKNTTCSLISAGLRNKFDGPPLSHRISPDPIVERNSHPPHSDRYLTRRYLRVTECEKFPRSVLVHLFLESIGKFLLKSDLCSHNKLQPNWCIWSTWPDWWITAKLYVKNIKICYKKTQFCFIFIWSILSLWILTQLRQNIITEAVLNKIELET